MATSSTAIARVASPAMVPNDWMENNYLKRESLLKPTELSFKAEIKP
jgi:hypothetical protein